MRNSFKKYGHFPQPYYDKLRFNKFIDKLFEQICMNIGIPEKLLLIPKSAAKKYCEMSILSRINK
jgi:hypothetical protein